MRITGWRPGFRSVSLTWLLQDLGLGDGKARKDRLVSDGVPIELSVPDAGHEAIPRRLEEIGVTVEVVSEGRRQRCRRRGDTPGDVGGPRRSVAWAGRPAPRSPHGAPPGAASARVALRRGDPQRLPRDRLDAVFGPSRLPPPARPAHAGGPPVTPMRFREEFGDRRAADAVHCRIGARVRSRSSSKAPASTSRCRASPGRGCSTGR